VKSRLFWKIWLSLSLVIVLVYAVTFVIADQLRRLRMVADPMVNADHLLHDAETVAASGGDLRAWLSSNSRNRFGTLYLLDAFGSDLNHRELPGPIRDWINRDGQRHVAGPIIEGAASPRLAFVRTLQVPGNDRPYTFLLLPSAPAGPFPPFLLPLTQVLIGVGIVMSGLVGWGLARHVTNPIRKLHLASERIAEGDFSGRVVDAIGRRRDEIGVLAERFDLMTQRVQGFLERDRTLLRDVSHELRSPMARIQVACDLIRQRLESSAPVELDRIEKELGDLDSLVEEVLLLSRVSTATNVFTVSVVDVVELLERIVNDADFEATRTDCCVRLSTNVPQARIRIDPVLAARALENVVRNALRYTRNGTTIDVVVTADSESERVRISVRDQGDGVPDAALALIFEPFVRVDSARTPATGGHGIGLALTKRIVTSHGGIVTARNHSTRGLIVDIEWPLIETDLVAPTSNALPTEAMRPHNS
jgi:two-component system sensor histidine kinase CpxA